MRPIIPAPVLTVQTALLVQMGVRLARKINTINYYRFHLCFVYLPTHSGPNNLMDTHVQNKLFGDKLTVV
jgi:hypothetical protein